MVPEFVMLTILMLAIYLTAVSSLRSRDTGEKLMIFASLSTKIAIFIVAVGTIEKQVNLVIVGALYFMVSGASVILLSYFLGRKER